MRPGRAQRAFSGVTRKSQAAAGQPHHARPARPVRRCCSSSVGVELGRGGDDIQWGAILWALVMAALAVHPEQHDLDEVGHRAVDAHRPHRAGRGRRRARPDGDVVAVPGRQPGRRCSPPSAARRSSQPPACAGPAPRPPPPRTQLLAPKRGVYLGVYDPTSRTPSARAARRQPVRRRASCASCTASSSGGARTAGSSLDWAERRSHDAGARPDDHVGAVAQAQGLRHRARPAPGPARRHRRRQATTTSCAAGRRDAARYRQPVVIRFMHEMNGTWYPWQADGNGNTPGDFKRAFRHVHRIFDRARRRQRVLGVLGRHARAAAPPTPLAELKTYYPGDQLRRLGRPVGLQLGPGERTTRRERSFLSTVRADRRRRSSELRQAGHALRDRRRAAAPTTRPAGCASALDRRRARCRRSRRSCGSTPTRRDADFRLGDDGAARRSARARRRGRRACGRDRCGTG